MPISRSNMIDSPGLIETNHQLELTLMSGQARTIGDIGNIIIKTTPAGAPLHINDVATVSNSVMPVYTVVTANGKPAVLLNVYRQPDSNTVEVANAVHAEIANLKKDLPPRNRSAPLLRPVGAGERFDQRAFAMPSCWAWCWLRSSWFCFCGTGALRWWPAW